MSLLKLIRWKNLLMIVLIQLLVKYGLLEPLGAITSLDAFGISFLILSTVCIAAAGNIINDIYDIETDLVNKPQDVIIGKSISEKNAFTLFIIFNVVGVGLGYYVSFLIGKTAFFSLFIVISALLYIYASYLKQTFLIGNIVVSILVGLSVLIVPIFDLLPAITDQNQHLQLIYFKQVFNYAMFAFLINLIREVAKDIEDIDGDYKAHMNTLPIVIGRERASNVLFALTLLPILMLIYYIVYVIYKLPLRVVYFLFFVLGPLIYVSIKAFNAKTKKHFRYISNMLKLVMLLGMLSILLYTYA
ncbi:geranylgeranylglycerol-phosphate geranylgeranyltransferase [Seonamhaeicola marinus]|uniref:Prenyltransferase n=1 Tax=Seonamhaeicola marinus TaxID=1912246 RepID=A0A5D0I432_9FLAO|nr:geranylgeranylglycerol-phosphate geranylgeranyltransferase [Seonamhaeicola marinus]TYA78426.1 prenyltransferase [Seonamhaeicola marinus]